MRAHQGRGYVVGDNQAANGIHAYGWYVIHIGEAQTSSPLDCSPRT
jgi:hypothetical protein